MKNLDASTKYDIIKQTVNGCLAVCDYKIALENLAVCLRVTGSLS